MKAIPRNYQNTMSNKDRELFDRAVKVAIENALTTYEHQFDTVLLYSLNECLGYGKERLLRLFKTMIKKRAEIYIRYSGEHCNDTDVDLEIMESALKEKGLDADAIVSQAYEEIMNDIADDTDANNKTIGDWLTVRYKRSKR